MDFESIATEEKREQTSIILFTGVEEWGEDEEEEEE